MTCKMHHHNPLSPFGQLIKDAFLGSCQKRLRFSASCLNKGFTNTGHFLIQSRKRRMRLRMNNQASRFS